MVGICPVAELGARHAVFTEAAAALRPLRAEDRARIRAARLRIRSPKPGERLEGLVRRTKSTWSVAELAVANDLDSEAPLAAGAPLKVPIPESWTAAPPVRNEGGGS